jgi:hypothetical protein
VLTLPILCCDPNNYISQKHYFKNEYTLIQVEAPDFGFSGGDEKNPISITFPKQKTFNLQLSVNSCGGQYQATTEGDIEFTRTNCSVSCCETDWDEYIITLFRKVTSYDESETKLYLYIDANNYLALDKSEKIITQS